MVDEGGETPKGKAPEPITEKAIPQMKPFGIIERDDRKEINLGAIQREEAERRMRDGLGKVIVIKEKPQEEPKNPKESNPKESSE